MAAKIIDGKAIAREIREGLKIRCERLKARGIEPVLAVVLVGDDPASQVYVRNKERGCAEVGIRSVAVRMDAGTSQRELEDKVRALNSDPAVHGILVQLPLPAGLDETAVLDLIAPEKDVDGFHPMNTGLLSQGRPRVVAGTPRGCMELLRRSGVETEGKRAVVVGRSNIVGRPMAMLLEQANATVTLCHSRTRDLAEVTRTADILVAAAGRPRMITGGMIKPGAAVIDVGINRLADGSLTGDVDFESACEVAGWITPVPGGVGPMTIAMLLEASLDAAERSAN